MSDEKKVHQGRNIKRFREMLGIKQEGLAWELGDEWSQKRVSLLEQKELIEEDILRQVSEVMKIPVEAFRNFDEEQAIFNIQNNYEGSHNQGANVGTQFNFNPIDKWVEALDENRKLHSELLREKDEKIALYQRMLKEKDEMIERMERLFGERG